MANTIKHSNIKKDYKNVQPIKVPLINGKKPKCVLLYSGGLDTSNILKWLILKGYDIITLTADVGQQHDDLAKVKEKAIKTGAIKAYVVDLKQEFVDDYIFEILKTGSIYENKYLMGCSPARAIISKYAVQVAKKEGCKFIGHGCTAKGNDTTRFMINCKSLDPELQMIVPWGDPEFVSFFEGRLDLIEFAKAHNIALSHSVAHSYSTDDNVAYLSSEAGVLEQIENEVPEQVFKLVPQPYFKQVANKPEYLTIHFQKGKPIKVELLGDKFGKPIKTVTGSLNMMYALNALGIKHAIGNTDIVETRVNGLKNHGVYQNPGAAIIYSAHDDMQDLCLDKEVLKLQYNLGNELSYIVYEGFWYSPEFGAIMAFFNYSQQFVNGCVTVKLYKGNVIPVARKSPTNSLYDEALVSMNILGGFNVTDTAGYQKIKSIRIINWNGVNATKYKSTLVGSKTNKAKK